MSMCYKVAHNLRVLTALIIFKFVYTQKSNSMKKWNKNNMDRTI